MTLRSRKGNERTVLVKALASDAEIIQADARALPVRAARAVVLFDVLHLMMPGEQDTLLGTIAGQLEPGGVVLELASVGILPRQKMATLRLLFARILPIRSKFSVFSCMN